jgi:perosamine synthetase
MIPITKPLTGDEEVAHAAEVIRSGWLTQGPKTAACGLRHGRTAR